jgi:Flp pilus assembly protein TadD
MNALEPPDSHHLSAASGWLGLGNWREAVVELEKIAPALRHHPSVLQLWYDIFARREQWDEAEKFARELVHLQPQDAQFWIWHAYATRRMTGGGILQAREILEKARDLAPDDPLISFNLACYECQLGNLQTAVQRLRQALGLGNPKAVKELALADKDLEPLWDKIREM